MTAPGPLTADAATDFDIIIVGGGIVGLSLANALIGSEFSVAVIDRDEISAVSDSPQCRVSAINRFALQHFRKTGVFHSVLAHRICVFERMFVWEKSGFGQIRFDSAELGVSELGAIIENNVLQHMLLETVKAADNISYLCPETISEIRYASSSDGRQTISTVLLASGSSLTTELLVGADGVNSRVRDIAAIKRKKNAYHQQGLVCNVQTELPHQDTAWQCFMPTGPLAFLPLYTGQSSIVWSLDDAAAERLMALDDDSFRQALAEAFEYRLGEISSLGQRFLFPLTHAHAADYVKSGLALIGDAAHNIHPLAGQGANLGIADAFALAEVIIEANTAGRQWSALHTLAKYQRQRKGANQLMEMSMTGFKELFGNDNVLVSELRNAGMSLVDQLPAVKYRVIRQALGVSD